jgi:chromosome segregation ATPase
VTDHPEEERASLLAELRVAEAALESERIARADLIEQHQRWERERQRLRDDRDRTSWLLLESEQRVAELLATPVPGPTAPPAEPDPDVPTAADLEIAELHEIIHSLQREIHGLRTSTSWRATRPLRSLSGILRRNDR